MLPGLQRFRKTSSALLKYIESCRSSSSRRSTRGRRPGLPIKGVPSDEVTICCGTVEVTSGKESFKTVLGPWSILGSNMLSSIRSKTYITDFTAYVKSDYCRILRLNRSRYYMLLTRRRRATRT